LTVGAVAVGIRGAVIFVNDAARHLTAHDGALWLGSRGFGATHAHENERLRVLIADAAAGGPGGAMRLRGPAGDCALVGVVSPLPRSLQDSQGLALVLLKDTAREQIPCDLFQAVYGLTSAEASLAVALTRGDSPQEIATKRHVRLTTVRTQIRQILGKTEAKNLRDLVRVLMSVGAVRMTRPPGAPSESFAKRSQRALDEPTRHRAVVVPPG
jgi:DNA-binding NarL/FixJ family response regulator